MKDFVSRVKTDLELMSSMIFFTPNEPWTSSELFVCMHRMQKVSQSQTWSHDFCLDSSAIYNSTNIASADGVICFCSFQVEQQLIDTKWLKGKVGQWIR